MKEKVQKCINEFLEKDNIRIILKVDEGGILEVVITTKDIEENQNEEDASNVTVINVNQEEEKQVNILEEITEIMHQVGVPANICGYKYLREAIFMVYNDFEIIHHLCKELYPDIAKKYQTTSSKVERAIRYAIELSWKRGDLKKIEELYSYTIDYGKGKPTNSEYISIIADNLRLKHKKSVKISVE